MENLSQNPFMPQQNTPESGPKATGLKIAVGLLALLVLAMGIYGVKKYKDFQSVQAQLEEEKQALLTDLEELKINYESALQENSELKSELEQAKVKVESLIAELEEVKATDLKIIRKYKNELYKLQKEKEQLFRVIDSLKQVNRMLVFEKDSLTQELQQLEETHQKVLEEKEKLAETVEKAKVLAATNLQVAGIKLKKNGKILETKRAKKTEQIRICFSVPRNPVVEPGTQVIYAQVINPAGEVIGNKDVIEVNGSEKIVSAAKEFRYDGQPMDICIFVIPETKEEIIKGNYGVILYHNGEKIAETDFELK